ncbi:MAG: hypothetical protein DRI52_11415 [Chloroflexi bacterium]|nr:MAG: hypothetical protein DRI52_11415 [Chloroflexota bacterium]
MHRQKHKLEFTSEGLLKKGVIIRVLALPGHIPEFKDIIERIKAIVNTNEVGISILTQYTPFFKAENFEEINRPLSEEEIAEIYKIVQNEDFAYGWIQEGRGLDKFAGKNFKAKFKL